MDLNGFIALVTALAALVVAVVTYLQLKHARFALGVDLLLKLEAQFDQPHMKVARSRAAKSLITKLRAREELLTTDLEPVLDFFETLGLLVRRQAVHEEVAWNSFSYWLERYATLGRDQIKARRRLESDWTYYENFEQLSNRFAVLDARKRKLKALPTLSDELLAKFLEEEVEEES
ncbi:MAG TPA: hypothetical protein VGL29_08440 [Blastocatellia bacterium]